MDLIALVKEIGAIGGGIGAIVWIVNRVRKRLARPALDNPSSPPIFDPQRATPPDGEGVTDVQNRSYGRAPLAEDTRPSQNVPAGSASSGSHLALLLERFTNDTLGNIADGLNVPRSGNKRTRIESILGSGATGHEILDCLTKNDLLFHFQEIDVPQRWPKAEIVSAVLRHYSIS